MILARPGPFAAVLLLVAGVCTASPDGPPESHLRELGSIDELRDAFDRDVGAVRLVLLLSPT